MGVNLQSNPGAESAVPEIVLTGVAARSTTEKNSGDWSVRLRSTAFGNQVSQAVWPDVTVVSGTKYRVRFWYNQDDPDASTMRFRIDPGSGFTAALTFQYTADLNSSDGWVQSDWIEFTATGVTASLEFSTDLTGAPVQDDWYIDDIVVEEKTVAIKLAERGVNAVITLLQDRLGTELGAIDTERGDGITMDVPATANYYTYPREEIAGATVHVEVFEGTIDFIDPYSDTDAARAVYELPLTVRVTHFNRAGHTPAQMRARSQRYASGVFIVMNKYPFLESADSAIQIGVAEEVSPYWETDAEDVNIITKTVVEIPVTLRCEEVRT